MPARSATARARLAPGASGAWRAWRAWRGLRDLPFYVVFAAFAAASLVIGLVHAFGPGQDHHYHVMSAALTARGWSGDPFYVGLYRAVNPLDSNTLFYTLLFPLEKVLSPVDAVRVGFSFLYFLGYPLSCVFALRVLRRPLWGALLAFPALYVKSWSGGAYLPFVASAPLMIVTMALLHRVLDPVREVGTAGLRRTSRSSMLTVGALCALLFLAHAQAFAWTLFVFALLTGAVIARGLLAEGLRDPALALRSAASVAGRMLAAVSVSLLLFVWWYVRKHTGAQAATGPTDMVVQHDTWQVRVGGALAYLLQTTSDSEFLFAGLLVLLCLATFLLTPRAVEDRVPTFEVAFLASLVAFLVLPLAISGQSLAPRQFDLAVWLLPIIVYPRVLRGAPVRHAALVVALVAFAAARMQSITRHLGLLQRELAGLHALTKDCPPGPPQQLAFVSMTMYSKHWHAPTFHHAAETLAASCRLDTPIYDPRIYPYNMPPIRYRGAPPATPTFLHDDPTWYLHPGLWDGYGYVLVHAWKPTPEQLEAANLHAERIRVAGPDGEWELWMRRPSRPQ